MKLIALIIAFLGFSIISTDAQNNDRKPITTVFSVNIDCQNCVDKITKELAFTRGVRDLQFSLENQTVAVIYRPDRLSKDVIEKKLKNLGYEVSEINKEEETK